MNGTHEFRPDWMSPPGETIRDLLHDQERSSDWLADALNESAEMVSDLLAGREAINEALAQGLAQALGASQSFWLRRDAIYRHALAAARDTSHDWMQQVPLDDMVKNGWIERPPSRDARIATILKFFGLSDAGEWGRVYESVAQNYAFRTSLSLESNPVSVSVWLRQGAQLAARVACAPWNPTTFEEVLPDIRKLTRQKDPQLFIPAVQKLCAEHGVALVVIPSVRGCRASGAARFESSEKAMIVMSARHLSEDHFWFTFFHEAAHLILHGDRRGLALDFENSPEDAEFPLLEVEANAFAAAVLIPDNQADRLTELPATYKDVIRFAMNVGISPGIVVGQLQHRGLVQRNWLNRVKRRYRWNKDQLVLA